MTRTRFVLSAVALLTTSTLAKAQQASPSAVDPAPAPAPVDPPGFAQATPAPTPATPSDETGEVRVAGSRVAQTAGSVHVVDKKKLERFRYDDPQAVLTTVPGVYGRGEDGFGLRPNIGMRGVNPDRSKKVTLMEDGILFAPAPYSAPAAYYFPLISRMTQVRLVKGVGAIVYGPQTIGGAIDLLTRPIPTDGKHGMLDAAFGEYAYNRFHGFAGMGDEQLGFLIEGVHVGSDGFKHLPSGADTGFVRNEWMFKGRYVLNPNATLKNEFRIKLGYSDEVSNETYVGLSEPDFRADPLQRYPATALDRMAWHRTSVTVSHVADLSSALSITTTAYRHDLSRTWRKVNGFRGANVFDILRDPDTPTNAIYHNLLAGRGTSATPAEYLLVGPNQRDFVSQGVETRIRYNGKTGDFSHRAEYGVRFHYDRIERRHSEDAFRLSEGALLPAGEPTVVTAFEEVWTHALALHATDAITWGPLTVTPGIRVETLRSVFKEKTGGTETSTPTQVVLPGIGAYYGMTHWLGVLGGVHRGFSPPAPSGAQNIQPELSVNYEGGLRASKGRGRAEVVGFYNDYSNLTDICTLSSGCVEKNLDRQFDAGKARIYGLEAYVEHDIQLTDALRLPATASYTVTRGEFVRDFNSEDPIFGQVRSGDEIPYLPRHQFNGSIGLESDTAKIAFAATYVSRMREVAGSAPLSQSLVTDAQFVVDGNASLRVYGPVTIYTSVRNIFDANYVVSRRPYGARPNAPRWIQVGAKVEF